MKNMKRGLFERKKGQGATWQLLLLLLGLAAVVIIVYFVFKAFSTPTGIIDLLPDDKQFVAQLCNGYAGSAGQSALGYCTDFKKLEISGKEQYANCDYLVDKKAIRIDEDKPDICDGKDRINFCRTGVTQDEKDDDILVNGDVCDDVIQKCVDQAGDGDRKGVICTQHTDDKCPGGKVIIGEFTDISGDSVCCGAACEDNSKSK